MKIEERFKASAADLAKLLASTARSVREAEEIVVANETIGLPENFEVRLKYKKKQEKVKFKIEVIWTPAGRNISPGIENTARVDSLPEDSTARPKGYKQLKKLMEEELDEIENLLRSGNVISESKLENWLKLVAAGGERGKPEWSDSYAEFQVEASRLNAAIGAHDTALALSLIAGIRDLRVKYHDTFKKKR